MTDTNVGCQEAEKVTFNKDRARNCGTKQIDLLSLRTNSLNSCLHNTTLIQQIPYFGQGNVYLLISCK
jgi:hypothetical protein